MEFHIRKTNGQLRLTLIVIKTYIKQDIPYTDIFYKIKTQCWWEYRRKAFFSPVGKRELKWKILEEFVKVY